MDWPEGVNSMNVWVEGVSGDQVVGTTRRVTLAREGSGGSVSEQIGVGSSSNDTSSSDTTSNSTSGSGPTGGGSQSNSNGSIPGAIPNGHLVLVLGFLAWALCL